MLGMVTQDGHDPLSSCECVYHLRILNVWVEAYSLEWHEAV